jgi:NAD(P)-dependent dehydrogenase (short-subunit alcohol dehydrogenase family)
VKTPLGQQVVVVAGASSGIGRAVARAAGARGAKVVVSARNAEALEAAVREIEERGSEALAVRGEATSEADAESLCWRAVERFGRIDTFVNSTMVTVYAEVEQLEPDELRRVMDVNFTGRAFSYWAALPHLKASRGTFVDVNSALAYRGIPLQAAYCASKAAARAFFESARVELEKHGTGVDLCLLLPGAMNTPQFDRGRQKLGLQPQPVPPIYQPEVTAAAVLHVCEHPSGSCPSAGAPRSSSGPRSSRRGPATSSCFARAGRRRRRARRSRWARPTTCGRRSPATRARTAASTAAHAARAPGLKPGSGSVRWDRLEP